MNKNNEVTRFSIEGDFSIYTATALRQRLLDALSRGDELEVDLSQINEIDSAGIQLMVASKRAAAAQNKLLRFINHSPAVFDIIELYDLAGHFGDPMLIHSQP